MSAGLIWPQGPSDQAIWLADDGAVAVGEHLAAVGRCAEPPWHAVEATEVWEDSDRTKVHSTWPVADGV